ncbi:MAG TPA: serine hydroxymethyltransferase [Candidatus Nitrosocosmicus sp.]|nr:serine hydroxymethyltransferase [Candidatus Nitrosocosmicus sp.]
MKFIKKVDPEIYSLIKKEEKRQEETLMMIPSENIASKAVEEAMGSSFGNKYGEGYPNKRYYQGNQVIDTLESTVIERAKKLFKVEAANVQPHSGSPANFAVYTALLNPGDCIMGLDLASGGHLTHGAPFNASSRYFRSAQYVVNKEGEIDYKALRILAKKEKPQIIVASTTAYARFLKWKNFSDIAEEVGAFLMADMSHLAGLVAAGVYPSPVPFAHIVTTTTHKTLRGPRGAMILTTAKGLKKDPDLAKKIDKTIIPGIQGGPHFNNIAGIGVALKEASTARFKTYATQVLKNAQVLAEELKKNKFDLVTGGTDCHLLLIDTRNKNLLGNTIAEGCDAAGIILNRNWVPFDVGSAFFPSGIRLGTPGLTSRGMKEKEMKKVAGFIHEIVNGLQESKEKMKVSVEDERKRSVRTEIIQNTSVIKRVHKEVKALCKKFPIKKEY